MNRVETAVNAPPKPMSKERAASLQLLLVIAVLTFMACFYYGLRPLLLVGCSIITSVAVDFVCLKLRKKKGVPGDLSAVVTGGVFALMLPASAPYEMAIAAIGLSVAFIKHAFGGKGNYIFNVPAAAFLFASICWRDAMLLYPKTETLDMTSTVSQSLGISLSRSLNLATTPAISGFDIMLGKFPGPMGGTHIIILLVCAVVLIGLRAISASTFFGALVTVLSIGWLWPQFGDSRGSSLYYELVSGMLVFGVVFLACDYGTVPKIRSSRLIYGVLIGLLTALFRRVGHVENAVVCGVLLANPIGLSLDRTMAAVGRMLQSFQKQNIKKRKKALKNKAAIVAKEAEELALRTAGINNKPEARASRKHTPAQRIFFFIRRFIKNNSGVKTHSKGSNRPVSKADNPTTAESDSGTGKE